MLVPVGSRPRSVLRVSDGRDDGDLLAALRDLDDGEDLELSVVGSVDDALAYLETHAVDCVVADAGGGGLDVRRAVRAEWDDLPHVLLADEDAAPAGPAVLADSATHYVRTTADVDEKALAERVWDAADRHRARARMVEAEQRARTLLDTCPDAILVSVDDQYVYANPAAVELFEADGPEDIVGLRPVDVIPSEGRQTVANVIDSIQAGERVVDKARRPIVTLGGNTTTVEITGHGFVWGDDHAVVATMRDVTERARLEAELRTREESARRTYRIAADRDLPFDEKLGHLLELGCDRLGVSVGLLTRVDDDVETVVESCADGGFSRSESWPLASSLARGVVEREAVWGVRDVGAAVPVDDAAREQFPSGCYLGAPVVADGAFGVLCFTDPAPRDAPFPESAETFVEMLSQWIGYELERERTEGRLREQNERLEGFASVVSHDLTTPLTTARGYLDLAREDGEWSYLDRVERSLGRMERIVDDLLYLAREGRDIGSTTTVDLDQAVGAAWEVVAGGTTAVDLHVEDGLGAVTADYDRLQQLLENVLGNAIEHGGPDVSVRVESIDGGFAIEDDGPGVPLELRERVFDRGVSTREDGTGIGLSIVEEIADAHGWTVRLVDSVAGGTRVEVHTGDDAPSS